MITRSQLNVGEISKVLGCAPNLEACCTSPAINKWARYKPVRGGTAVDVHKQGQPISSGIDMALAAEHDPRDIIIEGIQRFEYFQPYIYRIGDFENYKHDAERPMTVRPMTQITLNSKADRLTVGVVDQLSEYNLTFDDILHDLVNYNPDEWRLAVMVCNEFFTDCIRFWTSAYSWGSTHEDRVIVLVNANNTPLTSMPRVGVVPFLLKTGTDWEVDNHGYPLTDLPMATGPNAIALPTQLDHFIVNVVTASSNISILSAYFTSAIYNNRIKAQVPGRQEYYNEYLIDEVGMTLEVRNISENLDILNHTYIEAELYAEDYYGITYEPDWQQSLYPMKSSGSVILGTQKLADPPFQQGDTTEWVYVGINLDNAYMYLTHSDYDKYTYRLRLRSYWEREPGAKSYLGEIDIPYDASGKPINVFT